MRIRPVLASALGPVVMASFLVIILHGSKPVRTLAAELAHRHLDSQGLVALLFIAMVACVPVSGGLGLGLRLLISRRLLQNGQVVRGVITGLPGLRYGYAIAYQFSSDTDVEFNARFGPLTMLTRRPKIRGEFVMVGRPLTVLYDRDNPRKNIPYPVEFWDIAT